MAGSAKVHLRKTSRYYFGSAAICGTRRPELITQHPSEATCKRCLAAVNASLGCNVWMVGFVVVLILSDWIRKTLAKQLGLEDVATTWLVTVLFIGGLGAVGYFAERLMIRPRKRA